MGREQHLSESLTFEASERCSCNSHLGTPFPWVQVPFPEDPASVTILHSLTPRAREFKFVSLALDPVHNGGGRPEKSQEPKMIAFFTNRVVHINFTFSLGGWGMRLGNPAASSRQNKITTTMGWCRCHLGLQCRTATRSAGAVAVGGWWAAGPRNVGSAKHRGKPVLDHWKPPGVRIRLGDCMGRVQGVMDLRWERASPCSQQVVWGTQPGGG